jgi:amino acid adenylation domain-containing protein
MNMNQSRQFGLANESVYYDQLITPFSPKYNIGIRAEIVGSVDINMLIECIRSVAEQSSALRSIVEKQEDGAVIRLTDPHRDIPVIDFSDQEDAIEKAFEYAKQCCQKPFEFSAKRLWRSELLKISDDHYLWASWYHHIFIDGISAVIILNKICEDYNRRRVGGRAEPIDCNYFDYLDSDKKYLSSLRYQKDEKFWCENFKEIPPLLMPLDKSNVADDLVDLESPGVPSGYISLNIKREHYESISEFSRSVGCSQTHYFLALIACYFARVNRLNEVVIGLSLHGRPSSKFYQTIGMFASVIPLRITLEGNSSFEDVLREIGRSLKQCFRHQRYPLAELNRQLKLSALGREQLFDVSLSMEDYQITRPDGVEVYQGNRLDSGYAQIPLAIYLRDYHMGDHVEVAFEYDTGLFSAPTIQAIVDRIGILFDAARKDPAAPIATFEYLPEEEKTLLLSDFNQCQNLSLIEHPWTTYFDQQVQSNTQKIVVQCGDKSLSYAQLDVASRKFAQSLKAMGIGKEDLVALLDHRGVDLLVAIVGVLRAGAAYLPLDPGNPSQRWLAILNDAEPECLIMGDRLGVEQRWLKRKWSKEKVHAFCTVSIFEDSGNEVELCDPKLDDLAYVIYTSGSTGTPKGVMIEHRGMINNMRAKEAPLGLSSDDVIAQTASQCFDISVWQFLTAPMLGAKLVIIEDECSQDPRVLVESLRLNQVSIWEPVPVMLSAVIELMDDAQKGLPSLRWVLPTGDALSKNIVDRWFNLQPHVQKVTPLMNAYGPAECSDDVAFEPIFAPTDRVLIGSPVANVNLYVVDENLCLVPIGIVGELAISGPMVGRGYLNSSELTDQVFKANPFAKDTGDRRLYLSGDLVKRQPDGRLEYISRKDYQVKVRGFRIELGEVESAINQHVGIKTGVVLVQDFSDVEDGTDNRLVAYVCPQDMKSFSSEEVIEQLKQQLPNYMVPTIFITVKTMPITTNGKIDRKALPKADINQLCTEGYEAPETELEQRLCDIWQEVLGVSRVGRKDDFFALGGHSLLAMQLATSTQNSFGVELSLREVFSNARLDLLAKRIEHQKIDPQPELPQISASDGSGPQPLSWPQRRLWFIDQLDEKASEGYYMSGLIHFDGDLHIDLLNSAMNRVIQRHQVLRTVYKLEGNEPVQHVLEDGNFKFIYLNRKGQTNKTVLETLDEYEGKVFDLSLQAPIRGLVIKVEENKHILQITIHHIAADEWSANLLSEELSTIYHGLLLGNHAPLPELTVQYADYAAWQHKLFNEGHFQSDIDYWLNQLEGLPQVHSLPIDRPRPLIQNYRAGAHQSSLDKNLLDRVNHFVQQENITFFMLASGVFSLLLHRYSGNSDIVLGTPFANRSNKETEALIGFFSNTVILRNKVNTDVSVRDFLSANKNTVLDAYEHQSLPFDYIVEALNPERSLSYNPLFQVMINLENTDKSIRLDGNDEGGRNSPQGLHLIEERGLAAQFDLMLDVNVSRECLDMTWQYASDLFDASTIARMAGHFEELLRVVIMSPEKKLHQLNFLSQLESDLLIDGFNQSQNLSLIERPWTTYFDQQVVAHPDKVVAQCGVNSLSFAALDVASRTFAEALNSIDIGKEDVVALLDHRGLDLLVAIIGVLRAGAAYLPLDPSNPSQRWLAVLNEAEPKCLIMGDRLGVEQRWLKRKWHKEKVLAFSAVSAYEHSGNDTELSPPELDDLAYVIYTSGSTGTPKGVMIDHRGMINNMRAKEEPLGLTANDVIGQTASQCFDISVWQFLTAPMLGAKVLIIEDECSQNPQALMESLRSHSVSIWEPVPVMLLAVIERMEATQQGLTALRWVLPTGDALSKNLVNRWFALQPVLQQSTPLMNAYGPAECSDDVAFEPIYEPIDRVLIGSPIANVNLHVVDEHLSLVPIGVVGELAISGPMVGRGYLNAPKLTDEVFKPNPYAKDEGDKRLYLSGDLVKRQPDGRLEYIGRKDHQVKVRGFRVELGEIENSVNQHESIKIGAVLVHDFSKTEDGTDNRLVAYVCVQNVEAFSTDEVMGKLKLQLPEYMVPGIFIVLEALPVSANGKIDRKALPKPDINQLRAESYKAPQTELEKSLCDIWQKVLGVERVGCGDNFFRLGGHSLSATRLVAMINQQFDISLPLKAVFESQSLEALGKAISELESEVQIPPLVTVSRTALLPCSFAQKRLWLLDKLDGGSVHYNMPGNICLRGKLDIAALQHALLSIVERHESLRTCFRAHDDGEPVQIIQPAAEFTVRLIDLSVLEDSDRNRRKALRLLTTEEASRPFDLSQDLMLRATLVTVADNEHYFLATMHHIASDGWSMAILINEFCQLYKAFVAGEESPLPPLAIQYADYAHWQRHWLQGDVLEAQLSYWRAQLQNLPTTHSLPLDYPRQSEQSFNGAKVTSQLDQETYDGLQSLCQQEGATLFMGLHAVFAILLARYSNEDDIVVGTPIANREQAEVSNLIGFFINSLVLRSDLSGNPSFNDVLAQSRETLLGAYAHQQVPFEQIVERLQPERSLSHSPLFQVMLVLQNNDEALIELPNVSISQITGGDDDVSKYELILDVKENEDRGLSIDWVFNCDLFKQASIEKMALHFNNLLKSFCWQPETSVFSQPMLGDKEQHKVLIEWNRKNNDYPGEKCLHELFEEQAKLQGDNTALVYENQSLSFLQLNHQANKIARFLLDQKISIPECKIGICLERSLDLVIAILAVLKAGAAYVPLDPEYPEERLDFLVKDAQLTYIISEESVLSKSEIFSDLTTLCIDNEKIQQDIQLQGNANICSRNLGLKSTSLAYIIYTSGSTGKPKGVMIEHRSVVNLAFNLSKLDLCASTSSWGWLAPYAFDASVKGLSQLCMGQTLVILPQIYKQDPDFLAQIAPSLGVIDCTPMMVETWFAAGIEERLPNLIIGGETISKSLWQRLVKWQDRCNRRAFNVYGPTEATVNSHACLIQGDHVNIGRNLANTKAYVLNKNLQPSPVGVVGELYLGGDGLARGYYRRPEITDKVFIDNPFIDKTLKCTNERIYKTGDLVRWLPNGSLEYKRRIDRQVKVRGYRIELAEIESVIGKTDGIKDLAIAVMGSDLDQRLAAYICPQDVTTCVDSEKEIILVDAVRDICVRELPTYMHPVAFVLLEKLPMTQNGKLDLRSLPNPEYSRPNSIRIAPRTEYEKTLSSVWQTVLSCKEIGIADNFFEIGGHSLLVVKSIELLRLQGLAVSAKQFFESPVLENLAKHVKSIDVHENDFLSNSLPHDIDVIRPDMLTLLDLEQVDIDVIVSHVPGGVSNIEDIYPLVPLQQGILFHHQLNPAQDLYISPMYFTCDSPEKALSLIDNLQKVVNRHASLRTLFLWNDLTQPLQIVLRQADLTIEKFSLHDAKEPSTQIDNMMEIGNRSLDVSQAPLIRVLMSDPDVDGKNHLLLYVHHLISDHTSLDIVFREIGQIDRGEEYALTDAISYKHFVQRNLAVDLEKSQDYFHDLLADVTDPTLPFGLDDMYGLDQKHQRSSCYLQPQLSKKIRKGALSLGTTPATLFHIAWALVVSQCSGRDDVVFGTMLSGRLQDAGLSSRAVGLFVNMLPFRLKLEAKTIIELVEETKTQIRALVEYEHTPLTEALTITSRNGIDVLFSAMLNYRHALIDVDEQSVHDKSALFDGMQLRQSPEDNNFPFCLAVNEELTDFELEVRINSHDMEASRIIRYVENALQNLVTALDESEQYHLGNDDCLASIEMLSRLPKDEIDTVLSLGRGKILSLDQHQLFIHAFLKQCTKTPMATAVEDGDVSLSFFELDQRSSLVAERLLDEGIVGNSAVAVIMQSSADYIVAFLAIQKTGNIFVPVDISLPSERIAWILKDVNAKCVLTENNLKARVESTADGISVRCFDHSCGLSEKPKGTWRQVCDQVSEGDIAYVIYTSGSTGLPKGVMVSQRNLQNYCAYGLNDYYDASVSGTVLLSSLSFDGTLPNVILPLMTGGSIFIPDSTNSYRCAAQRLAQKRSFVKVTPSQMTLLLAATEQVSMNAHCLVMGGEVLTNTLCRELRNLYPQSSIYNHYGPTESTIGCSSYLVDENETLENIPLGYAAANTQIVVLNKAMRLLPPGVVGEIHILGEGVSLGYLGNTELSAKAFIENPWADTAYSTLYKTGDLGTLTRDGKILYHGRNDKQVKLRGYRIELNEIENCIKLCAGTSDVAVLAKTFAEGDTRLVAYLGQDSGDLTQLKNELGTKLPAYMVPNHYVVVETIPLTLSGKVDQHRLLAMGLDDSHAETAREIVSPKSGTEEKLAKIWQDVLTISVTDREANFFNLGGHSLLILQVVTKVKKEFSVEVPLMMMFEVRRLDHLARFIDSEMETIKNQQTSKNDNDREVIEI